MVALVAELRKRRPFERVSRVLESHNLCYASPWLAYFQFTPLPSSNFTAVEHSGTEMVDENDRRLGKIGSADSDSSSLSSGGVAL